MPAEASQQLFPSQDRRIHLARAERTGRFCRGAEMALHDHLSRCAQTALPKPCAPPDATVQQSTMLTPCSAAKSTKQETFSGRHPASTPRPSRCRGLSQILPKRLWFMEPLLRLTMPVSYQEKTSARMHRQRLLPPALQGDSRNRAKRADLVPSRGNRMSPPDGSATMPCRRAQESAARPQKACLGKENLDPAAYSLGADSCCARRRSHPRTKRALHGSNKASISTWCASPPRTRPKPSSTSRLPQSASKSATRRSCLPPFRAR